MARIIEDLQKHVKQDHTSAASIDWATARMASLSIKLNGLNEAIGIFRILDSVCTDSDVTSISSDHDACCSALLTNTESTQNPFQDGSDRGKMTGQSSMLKSESAMPSSSVLPSMSSNPTSMNDTNATSVEPSELSKTLGSQPVDTCNVLPVDGIESDASLDESTPHHKSSPHFTRWRGKDEVPRKLQKLEEELALARKKLYVCLDVSFQRTSSRPRDDAPAVHSILKSIDDLVEQHQYLSASIAFPRVDMVVAMTIRMRHSLELERQGFDDKEIIEWETYQRAANFFRGLSSSHVRVEDFEDETIQPIRNIIRPVCLDIMCGIEPVMPDAIRESANEALQNTLELTSEEKICIANFLSEKK